MFILEINTDNAAFEDRADADEVARILRKVANDLECGERSGATRDVNGNTVGLFNLDY